MEASLHKRNVLVWCSVLLSVSFGLSDGISIEFNPSKASFKVGENISFFFNISQLINVTSFDLKLKSSIDNVHLEPSTFYLDHPGSWETREFSVIAGGAGKAAVFVDNSSSPIQDSARTFIRLTIYRFQPLDLLILVVGWMYFAAWSISFYPQMIQNYQRKSVVGFNLDYVSLNMIGHTSYLFFNVGLFWIPTVQDEYFSIHLHGVNPVQLNDVLFSVHATFATAIHCIQCLIYDRGSQIISKIGWFFIISIMSFLTICLFLSITVVITWLEYLYFFSYVKLAITFIKYCPQTYMNYRRKSTEGWSIGFACFDFLGGIQSILQMILIAYNYDDWGSITGDPSKFGLGAVSVAFDIIFMIQHFCLYKSPPKEKDPEKFADKKPQLEKNGLDNPAFVEATTHM